MTIDLLVLVGLVFVAVLAIKLHDGVAGLERVADSVSQAGRSTQSVFDSAARSVAGAPIIGDQLAHDLRAAGASGAGKVIAAGRQAHDDVATAATLLGLIAFLVPAAFLLQRYLPWRISQIQRLTAAERVIGDATDPERVALLAQRAAFSLPYRQLLHHTPDPIGDLVDKRHDRLLAAELADAGMRQRADRLKRPGRG